MAQLPAEEIDPHATSESGIPQESALSGIDDVANSNEAKNTVDTKDCDSTSTNPSERDHKKTLPKEVQKMNMKKKFSAIIADLKNKPVKAAGIFLLGLLVVVIGPLT